MALSVSLESPHEVKYSLYESSFLCIFFEHCKFYDHQRTNSVSEWDPHFSTETYAKQTVSRFRRFRWLERQCPASNDGIINFIVHMQTSRGREPPTIRSQCPFVFELVLIIVGQVPRILRRFLLAWDYPLGLERQTGRLGSVELVCGVLSKENYNGCKYDILTGKDQLIRHYRWKVLQVF